MDFVMTIHAYNLFKSGLPPIALSCPPPTSDIYFLFTTAPFHLFPMCMAQFFPLGLFTGA